MVWVPKIRIYFNRVKYFQSKLKRKHLFFMLLSFCCRKFGHRDHCPAVAGSRQQVQQVVLPHWAAWSLTEQLPAGHEGSQEPGHHEAFESFLGQLHRASISPVSCSVSGRETCKGSHSSIRGEWTGTVLLGSRAEKQCLTLASCSSAVLKFSLLPQGGRLTTRSFHTPFYLLCSTAR